MKECKDIFKNEYQYALSNGFTGSHDDYVRMQYNAYCETNKRCGIPAAGWLKWIQNQN